MSHHHSHHHSHQHNVVLNLKDLDSTLAASHGGDAVQFEDTKNTSNNHSEYDTALEKLSKNLKGTKYESALKRLIKNKEARAGDDDAEFVPSPEKVKDEVEFLKLGRFVTATTLESYVDVPAVHSSATKELAKPLERNKFKKAPMGSLLTGVKSGNGMSTNHLGRQRPPEESVGIDNNGELDLQKSVQLASPAKERSRLAASASACTAASALAKTKMRRMDGTVMDTDLSLPPTSGGNSGTVIGATGADAGTGATSVRVKDTVHDLGSSGLASSIALGSGSLPATTYYQNNRSGMSVSLSDFDSWLRSNRDWSRTTVAKQQAAKDTKETTKPKIYKQSAHMKGIYAEKLKAHREHKEDKLLKSFITKTTNEKVLYDENSNTVQNRPSFKPEINTKTRKLVAKRDAQEGRTSDVAMVAGAYRGPAVKREPLQASLPKFVGLKSQGGGNSGSTGNHSRSSSPTGSTTPRKASLGVGDLGSRCGSPAGRVSTSSPDAATSRYTPFSTAGTPSSERRSRSLSPRLAYSARDNKTPHQRETTPSAFGSSCRTSRFDTVDTDLHFTERGRSTTRINQTPFLAPRCSSPTFSQRCCMVVKEGIRSTFRSASEPRERRDFKYMTAEAKRVLAPKQDTFADRIMASVERYYTRIGTQKQMRDMLYGKDCDNSLLTSVTASLGHAVSNSGLISGGSGGMATVSILGPGQYSKTEVHGTKGMKSRHAAGQRGYSFSKLPRATSMIFKNPIKNGGAHIGEKTGDWKTDLAKSGAPIHAQIKE